MIQIKTKKSMVLASLDIIVFVKASYVKVSFEFENSLSTATNCNQFCSLDDRSYSQILN